MVMMTIDGDDEDDNKDNGLDDDCGIRRLQQVHTKFSYDSNNVKETIENCGC